tara:strand:- start:707 stop:1261 length:555 start_codon:yes stop_codon:yes gene_type:complete
MKDIKSIFSQFSNKDLNQEYLINIDITNQRLILYKNSIILPSYYNQIAEYKISSSKYGEGNKKDSNKTPLGAHYIKEYIGEGEDILTIFKNRKPTNIKTSIINDDVASNEDIISTRILWLEGLEEGKNKGVNIDSFLRYIYIHGTNEEGMLGKKSSHGCIRMSNSDIIDLCSRKICNTLVYISI